MLIIDNQLVLSLDWYLNDEEVYDQIGMPRYMSLRRNVSTLAKEVADQLYMNYLYEYSDTLNRPFETFLFDTAVVDFPVRPHWHHYCEIIYMVSGNIVATLNEKEYYLK